MKTEYGFYFWDKRLNAYDTRIYPTSVERDINMALKRGLPFNITTSEEDKNNDCKRNEKFGRCLQRERF